MIDFTCCEKTKKTYEGANGNKICIKYNSELYMLKFPAIPSKNKDMSYSNSCISEYLGCQIYDSVGVPVQKTLLGTYTQQNGKTKIVVACKDLETDGFDLKNFASLKNTVIDSEHNGYGTELQDILDSIDKQQNIDVLTLKNRFWDMFIVDALIGNFDRHNGNWGFLYNKVTDESILAPVYDCGSCLYPQADKTIIKTILSSDAERNNRIYNFPTSAIKIDDKKINYRDYLLSTDDRDCLNSIVNIIPKINISKIRDIVDGIECLDDLQREFYKTMLSERYSIILRPAYEKALEKREQIQIFSQKDELKPKSGKGLNDPKRD